MDNLKGILPVQGHLYPVGPGANFGDEPFFISPSQQTYELVFGKTNQDLFINIICS